MKNYLFLLAFLFVSATVFAVPQGDGSVDNPYLVTDASELNEIRNHPDAHYRLMNDIDLGDWLAENSPEEGWEPINGFTGSLDGNGFAVSGFWINRPSIDNVGLFGSISGGKIKRLGLLMADGKGIVGNNNVGAFVGHTPYSTSAITIEECFVSGGTVEAKGSAAGGILGYTSTNSVAFNIVNCYVSGTTVIGADGAGGIVGTAYRSIDVENCYSTGLVKSANNDKSAGGIVGGTNDQSNVYTVKNCIALSAEIQSAKSAGRIVGWIKSAEKIVLSNNYAFAGTLVDGATVSGTATDNNGLDKTKEEVNEQATYESLGWAFGDEGIWAMGNGEYALPVLKNISMDKQPTVMPEYLELEKEPGSVGNPYLVTTASELNDIRNNPAAHYRLMNDIDLTDWLAENSSEEGWEPINDFTGSLDGNGFTISGFWINRPSTDKVGLFGSISGGTIKRLGLLIPDGKSIVGNNYVGGIVGHTPYTTSAISIEECFVFGGTIEAKATAAGAILAYTSTNSVTVNIRNCYVAGTTVIGADGAGGVTGTAYRSINIENCYSTGIVKSTNDDKSAGGIIGGVNDQGKEYIVKNCIALNSDIQSSKSAGRIVGWVKTADKTTLSNNYAFDGILVDGVTVSGVDTDNNGLGKSREEVSDQATYESLGWDFSEEGVWTMGNGEYALPVLKNFSMDKQPIAMPEHLKGPSVQIGEKESPALLVYPTVTNGMVFIDNKSASSMVFVYDLSGNMVMQSDASALNLYPLSDGIYLIKVEGTVVKVQKD